MRPYLLGGKMMVRKSINYDFPNLWLTTDQYTNAEIERMESMDFGQTWTVRFTERHQCHGAMVMLIHQVTSATRWRNDLDDEITYAVTPYVETDEGTGGFWNHSFLLRDYDLTDLLKVMNDRLGDLKLECNAARALFRQSLYKHLRNDEDTDGTVFTTQVSSYYSIHETDLYS